MLDSPSHHRWTQSCLCHPIRPSLRRYRHTVPRDLGSQAHTPESAAPQRPALLPLAGPPQGDSSPSRVACDFHSADFGSPALSSVSWLRIRALTFTENST